MAVQTKVPYRVTEKTLLKWLTQNFGENEAGKPGWSYVSVHNDWWQVTAVREITKDEIEDMTVQDKKLNSGSKYTFEVGEDD